MKCLNEAAQLRQAVKVRLKMIWFGLAVATCSRSQDNKMAILEVNLGQHSVEIWI